MKTKAVMNTIRPKNEDAYDITDISAFVIDGASGLTDKRFMPRGQDVAWMSQWWRKYLNEKIDNLDKSIKEILKEGVEEFTLAYSEHIDISELEKHELLSACIGIIRVNGERLELFILGDAEINIEFKNGEVKTFTDDTVEYLDKEVINLMRNNPNRGLFLHKNGFTVKEIEVLVKNRSKMNTEEGYYILSTDVEAIDNGIYRELNLKDIKSCMLATDGIIPLNERYNKKELMKLVSLRNLEGVVDELREIENIYKNSGEIRRLKEHDDITLIYVTFQEAWDGSVY